MPRFIPEITKQHGIMTAMRIRHKQPHPPLHVIPLALLFPALLLPTSPALAEVPPLSSLHRHLAEAMSSPASFDDAIRAGRDRAVLCMVCHGEKGISTRDWIPNLAGQSPEYLIEQMHAYASGKRIDETKNELLATLSTEELVSVTLYFISHPPEQIDNQYTDGDPRRGEALYQAQCQQCHGADGRGQQGYPWLAGQKVEYMRQTLRHYRNNDAGRSNAFMRQAASRLNDNDIRDVTAYIATIR